MMPMGALPADGPDRAVAGVYGSLRRPAACTRREPAVGYGVGPSTGGGSTRRMPHGFRLGDGDVRLRNRLRLWRHMDDRVRWRRMHSDRRSCYCNRLGRWLGRCHRLGLVRDVPAHGPFVTHDLAAADDVVHRDAGGGCLGLERVGGRAMDNGLRLRDDLWQELRLRLGRDTN